MSISALTIDDSLKVFPPLLMGSKKYYEVKSGPAVTSQSLITPSSVSNSQLSFNTQQQSLKNCIDPYMPVGAKFLVVCSGGTGGGSTGLKARINDNECMSLRQYPLNSVLQSARVQINNASLSSNPQYLAHSLSRFQDLPEEALLQSSTPILPDQAPSYETLIASIKNPLGSYAAVGTQYAEGRGSFNALFEDITNTNTEWSFYLSLDECVMHPWLAYSPDQRMQAYGYVQQLVMQLNFISNLTKMFSIAADTAASIQFTSITCNITTECTLRQSIYTAQPTQNLPPVIISGYNNVVVNPTQAAPVAAGAQSTMISQQLSLSGIPNKMYIFIGDSNVDVAGISGCAITDTYFAIDNVSVLFNAKVGLLSNNSALDNYNMLVAAEGAKVSWVQDRKFLGSVYSIDPTIFLGLSPTEAPGLAGAGAFNFQIQIQATNLKSYTVTPSIYVITCMDSVLTTTSASVTQSTEGVLSEREVLDAQRLPARGYDVAADNIYGGSSFDEKLKEFGKRVVSNLGQTAKFVKDHKIISTGLSLIPHPVGQTAAQIAREAGVGRMSKKELMARSLRY